MDSEINKKIDSIYKEFMDYKGNVFWDLTVEPLEDNKIKIILNSNENHMVDRSYKYPIERFKIIDINEPSKIKQSFNIYNNKLYNLDKDES